MNIGIIIKSKRTQINLTQEELAKKLYVSRATISNWETGRNYPDIETIVLISEVLEISLDQLLKGDFEMVKNLDKQIKLSKKRKIIILILSIVLVVGGVWTFFELSKQTENKISYEKLEAIDSKLYILKDTTVENGELKILKFPNSNYIELKKFQIVKISFDSDRLTMGYFLDSSKYEYDNMFDLLNKSTIGQESFIFEAPVDGMYTFAVVGSASNVQDVKDITIKVY